MISNTLRLFPGVGPAAERALWRRGVRTWSDYARLHNRQGSLIPNHAAESVEATADEALAALASRNGVWLAAHLKPEMYLRLAVEVPEAVLFLDVETTGLSLEYDVLTVIGWSDRDGYDCSVLAEGESRLRRALAAACVLVTFNGIRFDVPFLMRRFPDLPIPPIHLDLRYEAARHGWTGGQKAIEEVTGLHRSEAVASVGGENAPILWSKYRNGDIEALRSLVEYNHADVHGLRHLLDACAQKTWQALSRDILLPPPARFVSPLSPVRFAAAPGDSGINLQPFLGGDRATTSLREITNLAGGQLPVFIGIDLTGSETRESGWCRLGGGQAVTRRIGSDEALLQATLAECPGIVSIDSPLSLPRGRTRVTDDDPARATAGITRECERVLYRRHVRVYPCLIRSMQRLTERGIRLARTLREMGIPVIESFPGAAQDILGIPRKRSDLRELLRGLATAGVQLNIADEAPSHDELDAATSALVAAFLWADRYEALGNEEEDYLIVPSLDGSRGRPTPRFVLGLSGPIAAGKTTAARAAEEGGATYVRFSEVLADELSRRGIAISRESLQAFGDEVRASGRQRWLQNAVLARAGEGIAVVDGLRHPEDHAFFVEACGPRFRHVHLMAPVEERRRRYGVGGRPCSEFDAAEEHRVEGNVAKLSVLAHELYQNADDVSSLRAAARRWLEASRAAPPRPPE